MGKPAKGQVAGEFTTILRIRSARRPVEHAERPEAESEQENDDARENNRRSTEEHDHESPDDVPRFPPDPLPEVRSHAYGEVEADPERQHQVVFNLVTVLSEIVIR
jgi:hypothetical protein